MVEEETAMDNNEDMKIYSVYSIKMENPRALCHGVTFQIRIIPKENPESLQMSQMLNVSKIKM